MLTCNFMFRHVFEIRGKIRGNYCYSILRKMKNKT